MDKSNIEWTDSTWNPVTGCTQISPGCDNCYAKTIAENPFMARGFPNGFAVQLRPHKLRDPVKWKTGRRIFVNSMSDLFHPEVPDYYIQTIWETMLDAPQHTYQVLTKRAHRMAHKIQTLQLPTPQNIWLGVSTESQKMANSRIPALMSINAPVRWVSAEPLLSLVNLSAWTDGLAWVVVGGESGAVRRPMNYDWARAIRDLCISEGIPFLYKQGNGRRSGQDRLLDGCEWNEYPKFAPPTAPKRQGFQTNLI